MNLTLDAKLYLAEAVPDPIIVFWTLFIVFIIFIVIVVNWTAN